MATEPADAAPPDAGIYAASREVEGLEECNFYHVMDVPGHGRTEGEWDLRGRVDEYLGHVPLAGRRVLEVGTASGFLCFEMERRGAEVVALDLGPEMAHDLVPFAGEDRADLERLMALHVERSNNAWWLCHRAFGSRARLVNASVYDVPEAIGPVDVGTFGCVLLHLRDPFAALASALRLVRRTAIVTEFLGPRVAPRDWLRDVRGRNPFALAQLASRLGLPAALFLPDHHAREPKVAWWAMTPALVQRFLGTLGFDTTRVAHHLVDYHGKPHRLYTVVAERRRGEEALSARPGGPSG